MKLLKFLAKLLPHRHRWVVSRRISTDGSRLIYTLRRCECGAVEIRNRHGVWSPVESARFSILECFEEYHRRAFENSVPFEG